MSNPRWMLVLSFVVSCGLPVGDESGSDSGRLDGAQRLAIVYGRPGGWGSAEGVGADARLAHANDIVPVGDGTFYVLDCYGIERFDPRTGELKNLFGKRGEVGHRDGRGAEMRFRCPDSLVDDHEGHLYVADTDNLVIRRITTATGEVTTIAGAVRQEQVARDGVGPAARFYYPRSPFLYRGALFVVDGLKASAVRRIDLQTLAVTTFAGALGQPGYKDGAASEARFSELQGGRFDSDHTVYLADSSGVRVLDLATATVRTLAGRGASDQDGAFTQVKFSNIGTLGLVGDKLYVVEDFTKSGTFVGSRLRMLDLTKQTVTTLAGSSTELGDRDGQGADARFKLPSGIAASPMGDALYLVDSAATVRRYDVSTGNVVTLAGASDFPGRGPWGHSLPELGFAGRGLNGSQGPTGLVVASGITFLGDAANKAIVAVGKSGRSRKLVSGFPPAALAWSEPDQRLYAATQGGVVMVDLRGGPTQVFDQIGLDFVSGIAAHVDAVIVTDNDLHKKCQLKRLDPKTKQVGVLAGGECGFADGVGEAARFDHPQGLAVFGDRLFVADAFNHRIRVLDLQTRAVTTWAGSGAAGAVDGIGTAAQFNYPQDVALDGKGNLLIADSGNALVRRASLATGQVTTVVGIPREHGVRLSPARLNHPVGVAQSPLGLLISDEQGVFLLK
jgi:DNA-binding beta-propeller fold protein YncE